jgi:hypothetical protein
VPGHSHEGSEEDRVSKDVAVRDRRNKTSTVTRRDSTGRLQRMLRSFRYLRVDGLGLLLTKVGVRAHSKMIVFEEGVGLLTSAIAERLGGVQSTSCEPSHPDTLFVYEFPIAS